MRAVFGTEACCKCDKSPDECEDDDLLCVRKILGLMGPAMELVDVVMDI